MLNSTLMTYWLISHTLILSCILTTPSWSNSDHLMLVCLFKQDLDCLSKWFQANGLLLNPKKTNAISFKFKSASRISNLPGLRLEIPSPGRNVILHVSVKLNKSYFVFLFLNAWIDMQSLLMVYLVDHGFCIQEQNPWCHNPL